MTVLLPAINKRLKPERKTTTSTTEMQMQTFLVFAMDGLPIGNGLPGPLSRPVLAIFYPKFREEDEKRRLGCRVLP
jgi:hypothetical protein